MVDAEVVAYRLSALRTNARRLLAIVEAGRETFLGDEDAHLKAERCLQIAIQAILDIASHVTASEGLSRPESYEDLIPALGRAGMLPTDLVERLGGIAGLRNILVHDYLAVDHGQMFDELQTGLADFEEFAVAIEKLLHRQGER